MRSLYDPVGLAASIFTQISAQSSSTRRSSRTTGVPPIAASPPGRVFIPRTLAHLGERYVGVGEAGRVYGRAGVAGADEALDVALYVPHVDVHAGQDAAGGQPERDVRVVGAAEDDLVVAAR